LFNQSPSLETIQTMMAAHRRFGTTGLLPTLITDTPAVTDTAIAAATAATQQVPGCLGLHLEGPFLSPSRKGAHLAKLMRPMQDSDVDRLIRIPVAPLLITVAVEQVTPHQVARLCKAGVIVSLGHSDATYADARALIDAGARGVTHLFNAMSQMSAREPGLSGTALASPELWCSLIADGHHVHPAAMALSIRAKKKPGKIFLISDAMSTVGSSINHLSLNGREIIRHDNRLTLPDGTLAGSNLDMASAVRNCVQAVGVSLAEALRMASLYPAEFLHLSKQRGRIRRGMAANLVHLDDTLHVTRTWLST